MAKAERNKCRITFTQPSLTEQSHADACDINNIVARVLKSGYVPYSESSLKRAFYGDVTAAPRDFMEAQQLVVRVNEVFDGLPSELRERFDNDPSKFVEFVENPKNRAECLEIGLLAPEPKEQAPAPKTSPEGNPAAPVSSGAVSGPAVKEGGAA